MDKNTFKLITNDGTEVTCNVLFTFDSDETIKFIKAYIRNE